MHSDVLVVGPSGKCQCWLGHLQLLLQGAEGSSCSGTPRCYTIQTHRPPVLPLPEEHPAPVQANDETVPFVHIPHLPCRVLQL
ncbi:hypothetical protein BaRGS_00032925 [Batillaria attramentaria]|uniref:Uncharacterized protein n=1 Tax=Batillaria attramentaria TaxID=370345 RepID=A0ABD0JMB0_9CAEN